MRITFAMSNRLVGAEAADWLEMRGCLTELSDDSCLLTVVHTDDFADEARSIVILVDPHAEPII